MITGNYSDLPEYVQRDIERLNRMEAEGMAKLRADVKAMTPETRAQTRVALEGHPDVQERFRELGLYDE